MNATESTNKAEEILASFVTIAPFFNDIVPGDIGLSVIKNGRYIAYVPAQTLDFGNK